MRVTANGVYASLNRALQAAGERSARVNEQLASGRVVSQASDNPTDASQLLRLDSEVSANASYMRAASDSRAWLATIDNVLVSIAQIAAQGESLSLAGQNGSNDATARAAIAEQITQLRQQVAGAANASYLGQSVLAGYSAEAVTYDAATDTFAFTGTVGAVQRQIDANTVVDVSYDGQELLGFNRADGNDIFTTLTNLATAVANGDSAGIEAARNILNEHTEAALTAAEVMGTRLNTVDRMSDRLTVTDMETKRARSEIGDVDMAKAVLEVQAAQTAYQAALAAIAKANVPSLADYLR